MWCNGYKIRLNYSKSTNSTLIYLSKLTDSNMKQPQFQMQYMMQLIQECLIMVKLQNKYALTEI